jgi:hypothetical protein
MKNTIPLLHSKFCILHSAFGCRPNTEFQPMIGLRHRRTPRRRRGGTPRRSTHRGMTASIRTKVRLAAFLRSRPPKARQRRAERRPRTWISSLSGRSPTKRGARNDPRSSRNGTTRRSKGGGGVPPNPATGRPRPAGVLAKIENHRPGRAGGTPPLLTTLLPGATDR